RLLFFFSSRRRHTRFSRDWSSDVCSSDLCPAKSAPFASRLPNARHRGTRKRREPSRRRDCLFRQPGITVRYKWLRTHWKLLVARSEERRVGKECIGLRCRDSVKTQNRVAA